MEIAVRKTYAAMPVTQIVIAIGMMPATAGFLPNICRQRRRGQDNSCRPENSGNRPHRSKLFRRCTDYECGYRQRKTKRQP